VLDANPLTIAPDQLNTIRVVATIKDGQTIHGTIN
jgi:predicted amidohydrolase YtcJ